MQDLNTKKFLSDRRICFVIPHWATSLGTGGAELQCYYLSEEFLRRGWKVEVLSRKSGKSFDKRFFNPQVRYLTYSKSNIRLIEFLRISIQLLRSRSKYYYNRTDARLLRGTCGLFCKLFRKKIIIALANDSDAVDIPLNHQYKGKLNSFGQILHHIDATVTDFLINKFVFNTPYIVSQTKTQQILLEKNLKKSSRVIPNSFIFPGLYDIEKENIILWVANIRPQKQPALLRDLLARIDLKGWKVKMVGNYTGYENIIKEIRSPNFEALGQLSFEEVTQLFERSKILINTSSSEGFPNTFLLAWAYKTLVISYSFDPEKWMENLGVGLCANGDFEKLVRITQEQIDFSPSDTIVDKANKFVFSHFKIEENVDQLIQMLD